MTALSFDKYEGAGNDFIVVDAASERAVTPEAARRLCDRRFGIGADGVLLVVPAESGGAVARMVVLNADGSRPEMCGNGIRCVALHLARKRGDERAEYYVETDAGELRTLVERESDGEAMVTVGMGRGVVLGERRFPVRGEERAFILVSMGNPHAVAFGLGLDEAFADELGPALSAATEGGTNVELVEPRGPRAYEVIVWERGVGRTFACGTGAAAVAVAAVTSGRSRPGERLEVALPGGRLFLTVAPETLEVTLTGPARRVFSGRAS